LGFYIFKKLNQENSKSAKQQRFLRALSNSIGFGFTVSLPIAGGAIIGFMIDNKLNTHPKATLSLLFTGIFIAAGAIYQVINGAGGK